MDALVRHIEQADKWKDAKQDDPYERERRMNRTVLLLTAVLSLNSLLITGGVTLLLLLLFHQ